MIWAHTMIGQTNSLRQDSFDQIIYTWLADMNDRGVRVSGDSIEINEESDRILRNEDYRKNLYPKEYTWPEAIELLKKQELKKAFWYLLNLYLINDQNKELVIKSMLTYASCLRWIRSWLTFFMLMVL